MAKSFLDDPFSYFALRNRPVYAYGVNQDIPTLTAVVDASGNVYVDGSGNVYVSGTGDGEVFGLQLIRYV